jgi:hypothetical protein
MKREADTYITLVQSISEQDRVSSSWSLIGLVWYDCLRAVKVVLDGHNGDRRREDLWALVSDTTGWVRLFDNRGEQGAQGTYRIVKLE